LKRYGLIGHPLAHSFSKAWFTEKFEKEHIDACYENYDLDSIDKLPRLIGQHPDLCGFNVTIPFKEAILPHLDDLDETAKEIKAVNTVKVMAHGRLKGFNTDVIGIEITLHSLLAHKNEVALILGTGGASKAVQYVLKKHNYPYHLVSRNPNKGDFTYETLTQDIIKSHLLMINATPIGMAPHIEAFPDIPYEAISSQHTLFDLIYNPEETLFLKHGRKQGATVINGMTMLHAQAEEAWQIWNKESK
jgi:shikimate dehydrogenase